MKLNAYAILDEKALAYNQPFFMHHDGQATRAFEDEYKRKDSMIHAHPGDYKLYRLGTYDQQSGKLESLQEPVFLIHAVQFVETALNKNQTEMEL